MLTAKEIEAKLREMKPFLAKQFKVKKIGYFGSFAVGKATEDSDIDILVDFSETPGWEYFTLQAYLEKAFNRKIDLATEDALRSYFKDSILKQAKFV